MDKHPVLFPTSYLSANTSAFALAVQKSPRGCLPNTSKCTISAFLTFHPQLARNRLPKGGGVGGRVEVVVVVVMGGGGYIWDS